VPSALHELEVQRRILPRDVADFVQHLAREKGIISSAQEKRAYANAREIRKRARACVVIIGISKSVYWRRDEIIEIIECLRAENDLGANRLWKAGALFECLPFEGTKKMRLIQARESAVEVP